MTCHGEKNVIVTLLCNLSGLKSRPKPTEIGFLDVDFFPVNGQAVLQTAWILITIQEKH